MHTHIRPANTRSVHRFFQFVLTGFLAVLPLGRATGQLAITEVLSAPSATPTQRGEDYWELTNFGTDTANLESFWFADSTGFPAALNLAALASDPHLGPGESIVFVRSLPGGITNSEDFRQWWGDSNLPSNPKIAVAPWPAFGLSSMSDAVQLWQVTSDQPILLDRVELFRAEPGVAFTYDPATGLLDTLSKPGVNGAFRAATTSDVGSPGVTTGPVPLRVVQAPASTEVDGGSPVSLTVRAHGLPRPRYQWFFNGQPISDGAGPAFTIMNAGTADAGEYTVEVSNGLTTLHTPPAILTVNLTPICARIVRPPADVTVTPGQTAIFRVEVRGFPLPDFQWRFNDVDIPGATNATYAVEGADDSDVGLYCVRVTNALCSTNACARLEVVPVPKIVITEAMANPSTNSVAPGHEDWWELTNMDTYAVNLRGYRFDDFPGVLEGAVVVTNDITLRPGQSMIWVSSMTPEAFRRWWGEENLPTNLPIVSYPGNGFSELGDMIQLWNATALYDYEWLVSLSFVNLEAGISLWFDDGACEFGCPSVEGERGAFRAAESDDIGSPGWTTNRPKITSIRYDLAGVALTWKTQPGRTYELQYCDRLAPQEWMSLRSLTADGDSLTTTDSTTAAVLQRFYRVELLPP